MQPVLNGPDIGLTNYPSSSSSQLPNGHVAGLVTDYPYSGYEQPPQASSSTLAPPPLPPLDHHNSFTSPSNLLNLPRPLSPSTLATLSNSIRNNISNALSPASSFSSQLGRSYKSAEAIAADVDALQNSISSLVGTLGLDPAAAAQLRGEFADLNGGGAFAAQDEDHLQFGDGSFDPGDFDMASFLRDDADRGEDGLVNGLSGEDLERLMTEASAGASAGSGMGTGGGPRGKKRKSEGGTGFEESEEDDNEGAAKKKGK